MDKRDNFEEKIKAKLEEVSGNEADQAWQSFAPLLNPPAIPFWKHWSMPYLFASVLFLTSLAWHQWGEKTSQEIAQMEAKPVLTATDTVFRRDTVYVVDTVYVYKKVYLNEVQSYQSAFGLGSSDEVDFQNPVSETWNSSTAQTKNDFEFGKEEKGISDQQNSTDSSSITEAAKFVPKLSQVDSSQISIGELKVQTGNAVVPDMNSQQQANSTPVRRSMAAPSVAPQEKYVFKSEKELVEGDTSNLNQAPVPEKSKPMLHLELGGSLLFPISNLVEYYTPFQQNIHLGLEWESGWGVYLGAIRNNVEGELDDEEILSLPSSVVNELPNIPSDINSLDEIYVINRQWFFPLELRWRSLYYSGFSFESSFALMGNYLSKQDFTYEFENFSEVEYQYGSTSSSEFNLSHLKVGIGTNYLMTKRLGLFLRSHYWLPISRPGLLQDRMHGLEVGIGVNVFLGK
ncbi:hypothetical protein [uncultured Algoriphagus sp.]|uniref:hypothetical protein n=1 Tax=uncultured Algoriphagus sp. TaxID=417365 RepID=UPI00259084A4|nr:hypothetical protein [uncultured Algoriphagus sp.]